MTDHYIQRVPPGWFDKVTPDPPERVRLARTNSDAAPLGMHVCQSGRADGASFAYVDEFWECPFCEDRGEGWKVTDSVG